MDASVVWEKGLSFTGTGLTTSFSVPMGADPKVGGANDGFRPPELLLVGLGGCTGMDVISILAKKRQEVTAFEVKTHGERAPQDPQSFTSFVVEYVVTGRAIDRGAVEQAVRLSETKYCGVMDTLRKAGHVEIKITIKDA
jgi:putative redox protein